MAVQDNFKIADEMIHHLNTVVQQIKDPFIQSRYVGFVTVAAVTVYELAIKEIFYGFAQNKHRVFGQFTRSHFERINGRIKRDEIEKYVEKFGVKYLDRFKTKVENIEKHFLKLQGISIKESYANIITWRNQFAHEGQIPNTPTYDEVVKSYEAGKYVIICIGESMNR